MPSRTGTSRRSRRSSSESIGVDVRVNGAAPINFDRLRIPEPNLPAELRRELERTVGEGSVSSDPLDRVVHSRGKSLRDLIRQRQGELPRLPDVIVRPGRRGRGERHPYGRRCVADAVMIPFGGGSSISGSLEAQTGESRPVISVDLERLDQVLDIDAELASRACAGRCVRPATWRSSSRRAATPSATSPTRSHTRRSAAGSPPGPLGCSPTATATSRTWSRDCAW